MQQKKFYYGWFVAMASALGIASSIGAFVAATIGLLIGPLGAEYGWTKTQIVLAPSWATGATILVAPFLGSLVDKFGARRIIGISFVIEAIIIASFYFINDSLPQFYARYFLFAILATGTTAIAFAKLIARWFDKRRGLAMGIVLAGQGLGSFVWLRATQWLIDMHGWRETCLYLAAYVALVALPIIMLVVRESPQSIGLNVDGVSDVDAAINTPAARELTGQTRAEAMRIPQFWLIAITNLLLGFGMNAVIINAVPIMTTQGATVQTAAAVVSTLFLALVVGRISSGWFMDRFFAPHVAIGYLLLPIIGVTVLSQNASGLNAYIGVMLVGLATGAEVDVIAYVTSRYFGLKQYSAIYAVYYSMFNIGSAVGPVVVSGMAESQGSYAQPLYLVVGIIAVCCVLFYSFRPFPAQYVAAEK
ncbi:MAG: MFS transporter [Steroidobacteraceae bacterium]